MAEVDACGFKKLPNKFAKSLFGNLVGGRVAVLIDGGCRSVVVRVVGELGGGGGAHLRGLLTLGNEL